MSVNQGIITPKIVVPTEVAMPAQIIGATIAALIILGGMYAIVRNLAVFFLDMFRGFGGKAWYNRPYLFRALAWAFTLVWLYGPYAGKYDALHLSVDQQRGVTLGLYLAAAASWLWLLRVSYLDGIPQHFLHLPTRGQRGISWHGMGNVTYLLQLLCAAALGVLFVYFSGDINAIILQVAALALVVITAVLSLWRTSYLAGMEHTFRETAIHVFGGRDAGPPHAHQ
jgi:hypothetical protein